MTLVWTGDARRGLPDEGGEAMEPAAETGSGIGGTRGDRAAGAAGAAAGLEKEAEGAAGKGGGLPDGVVPVNLPMLLRNLGVEDVKVAVAAVMAAACSGAAAMETAKRALTELELESLGQVAEDNLGGGSRWACHLCKGETALVVALNGTGRGDRKRRRETAEQARALISAAAERLAKEMRGRQRGAKHAERAATVKALRDACLTGGCLVCMGCALPAVMGRDLRRNGKASGAEMLELRKGLLRAEIAGKSSKLHGTELRQRALRGWAAVRGRVARREAKAKLGQDEFRMVGRVFCEGGRRLCVTKVTRDEEEKRVVYAEDMDRWAGPGARDNKEERFSMSSKGLRDLRDMSRRPGGGEASESESSENEGRAQQ
jgi:hypothetical protein